jgi:hypothetical protein
MKKKYEKEFIFSFLRNIIFAVLFVAFAVQVRDQITKFLAKKTTITQRFVTEKY